ncbi:hypothetical protein ACHAO5_006360 [Verticillium nonalfalfae]
MSLSLPGYYYDEVKKKYFKIEKSHSAPASAAWSAANVKRRKIESEHTAAEHARAERTKRNVKRARALHEPLLGGFLDRQLANHYRSFRMAPGRRAYSVNLATPAPTTSSELICTLATDDGIIRLTSNNNISWITPKADGAHQRPPSMDVLAQAFNVANPSILYAGTRSSTVRTLDLRAPPQAWSCFKTASAVTHLRSLESNPNHILVAALRSNLHIYDLRFLRMEPAAQTRSEVPRTKKRNRGRDHGRFTQPSGPAVVQPATPVLTFPEYRNEAHTHIGFDVNQDVGVVAAAHDTHDGRVALYSLRSGLRLRAPAVDRASTRGPVRSLVFRSMPMERHASLWIGHQGVVKKYSVGVSGEDDEA